MPEIPAQNANFRSDESSSNNSDDSENSKGEGGGNRRGSRPKLFEELRENVYREVASLISANEGRPHFLIQLFRDLQFVSSDPLRRRTLQSIHSLVTSDYQVRHPLICESGSPKVWLDAVKFGLLCEIRIEIDRLKVTLYVKNVLQASLIQIKKKNQTFEVTALKILLIKDDHL